MQSRRDDPTVKGREHALQTLDLAYHKYREIVRNLEEGLNVGWLILHDSASLTVSYSIPVLQRALEDAHAVQGGLQDVGA